MTENIEEIIGKKKVKSLKESAEESVGINKIEVLEQKNGTNTLVYCGPSVPGIGLTQFSVFKNGIPSSAEVAGKECKSLISLFKPLEQLSKTRIYIEKKGSRDHQLFENVMNYVKGE